MTPGGAHFCGNFRGGGPHPVRTVLPAAADIGNRAGIGGD
jgi:hypothetical protein